MTQVFLSEKERELVNDFLVVIEGLLPLAELVIDELGPLRNNKAVCEHIEKAQMTIAVASAFRSKYNNGENAIE